MQITSSTTKLIPRIRIEWTGCNQYNLISRAYNNKITMISPHFANFMQYYFGNRNIEVFTERPSLSVSADLTPTTPKMAHVVVVEPQVGYNDQQDLDYIETGFISILVDEINHRAQTSDQKVTYQGIKNLPDWKELCGRLLNDVVTDFHLSAVDQKHFNTHVVAAHFQVKPAPQHTFSITSGGSVNSVDLPGGATMTIDEDTRALKFAPTRNLYAFPEGQQIFIKVKPTENPEGEPYVQAVDAQGFNRIAKAGRFLEFVQP